MRKLLRRAIHASNIHRKDRIDKKKKKSCHSAIRVFEFNDDVSKSSETTKYKGNPNFSVLQARKNNTSCGRDSHVFKLRLSSRPLLSCHSVNTPKEI